MADQIVAESPRFASESDKQLFLALRRRLWDYEPLRASRPELELDVTRGTVRIAGRVRTLAMKEIIGYLCAREGGVVSVRNELISDTEVQRTVADVLAADPELGPLCLRVGARAGIATISGDVPEPGVESRALEIARSASGVADVVSELAVRPGSRPATAPAPTPAAAASGEI